MKVYGDLLVETISKNEPLIRILKVLKELNLPFEYYVGAGCITISPCLVFNPIFRTILATLHKSVFY